MSIESNFRELPSRSESSSQDSLKQQLVQTISEHFNHEKPGPHGVAERVDALQEFEQSLGCKVLEESHLGTMLQFHIGNEPFQNRFVYLDRNPYLFFRHGDHYLAINKEDARCFRFFLEKTKRKWFGFIEKTAHEVKMEELPIKEFTAAWVEELFNQINQAQEAYDRLDELNEELEKYPRLSK